MPTRVYLLDFFCSSIQFYELLSPHLSFISFLYLDLYFLGDDGWISKYFSCKPNIYVSMCLDSHLNRSKAVLLLWINRVIYVLCLSYFHACILLPCGHLKGRTDLLALVCDALLAHLSRSVNVSFCDWSLSVVCRRRRRWRRCTLTIDLNNISS